MSSTSTWPKVFLGEICEFKYGKGLPAKSRIPGPFGVYGSNGAVGSHIEAATLGPTIIVGRKGSFGEVHYSDAPCWPIDTTYYVDASATECDLRWLAYRISSLGLTSLNRAAAIPGLNREDAYRQTLLLPPLVEQRRIAQVLDQVDTLRAKRRGTLTMLDNLAQSIFLDMFGSPLTNPMGWPVRPLGELGRVTTGNTPSRSETGNYGSAIEWIKSDNIDRSSIYLRRASEGLSVAGMKTARIVETGSLLVTCIAGSPASIGNVAIANRRVAFNQQINALTPSNTDSLFLYFQLCLAKPLVLEKSTGGMKGLVSKSRFESLILLDPPPALQADFTERVRAVLQLQSVQHSHLAELDALFASLQHRAFRGELWPEGPAPAPAA
ncbi:MAG: restriction endonuclease subunit S [Streptomycetaceae bacterium]|nr:restriction endonuclease subunit S [Streptomycetaceae bacterium]